MRDLEKIIFSDDITTFKNRVTKISDTDILLILDNKSYKILNYILKFFDISENNLYFIIEYFINNYMDLPIDIGMKLLNRVNVTDELRYDMINYLNFPEELLSFYSEQMNN